MRILLTGKNGQVGFELQRSLAVLGEVLALGSAECDLRDEAAIRRAVQSYAPDVIVNPAAYTAVDKAESQDEDAEAVNARAPGVLAQEAQRLGALMLHFSTDYVFDGLKPSPYLETDDPAPASAYGRTKLAGEQAAAAHHPAPLIIRTAWVYAAQGNNFVRTMLRLMAERDEVRVVADQVGTPTHALSLARAIWALQGHSGIFHWTDAGITSWYDFAVAIQDEALRMGLLTRHVPIIPIATADYPTPARRPAWSVLDKGSSWAITGPARHWRHELIDCLKDLTA